MLPLLISVAPATINLVHKALLAKTVRDRRIELTLTRKGGQIIHFLLWIILFILPNYLYKLFINLKIILKMLLFADVLVD